MRVEPVLVLEQGAKRKGNLPMLVTLRSRWQAASFLAGVVVKAHARQMNEKSRKAWSTELERYRSKTLDAPSWLWSSVVSPIGNHETAYLEH